MFKSQLQQIIELLTSALEDAEKFDTNNDAAGRRVRGFAQEAKTKLQELRVDIQNERNQRKAK